MRMEKELIRIEREIRLKMNAIKAGRITAKDSGIGRLINLTKDLDGILHSELMSEYKKIMDSAKK